MRLRRLGRTDARRPSMPGGAAHRHQPRTASSPSACSGCSFAPVAIASPKIGHVPSRTPHCNIWPALPAWRSPPCTGPRRRRSDVRRLGDVFDRETKTGSRATRRPRSSAISCRPQMERRRQDRRRAERKTPSRDPLDASCYKPPTRHKDDQGHLWRTRHARIGSSGIWRQSTRSRSDIRRLVDLSLGPELCPGGQPVEDRGIGDKYCRRAACTSRRPSLNCWCGT